MEINSAKPIELKDKSQDKIKRYNKKTGEEYPTYPSFSPRQWLSNLFEVHFAIDSKRVPRNLDDYAILSAKEVKEISDAQNEEFKRLGWDMSLNLTPNVAFKAITSGQFEPKTYSYTDDEGNKHYALAIQYEYKQKPNRLGLSFKRA
mgnify:CR=1 FL=1